ncbi:Electron transport complex subunit RsxG [Hydrogenovibrio crunogenus]|uniref:Ion-translocating oxidoreductase complex subunit G n=1 Tax=Hydrogenovibrio crunogenus TaxID=39765 RepID=A0A4P7NZV8_9GAMM|nr:electron transport complex subunit RsxG [Hydrogenovibrio crunogenus]QBZ83055.1 Electron transport complex subunit RsxG [Hydrogenovibrio crunogenus]
MANKDTTKKSQPKQELWQRMLRAARLLSIYTVIGVGLLLLVKQLTDKPIQTAEKRVLLETINQLLPSEEYDNALLNDTTEVTAPKYLNTTDPVTVYRARKNGQPVALILTTHAPDGYNGDIKIMLAVYKDGRIAGVRVLKHKETPGLGDKIELKKSNWILGFNGLKLREDNANLWAVRKDGGGFDQFTGATITPRAVIKAVKNALQFIQEKGAKLYE